MLKLQWVRGKIFSMVLIAVTIGFVWKYTLTEIMARHPRSSSPGVTRLWYKQPILSVYIPSRYQGNYCAPGYEAVTMNNTISSISSGPCGCAQNTFRHRSTNASCSHSKAETCVTMPGLPAIESTSWRHSTICVKRGGEAAATIINAWWFQSDHSSRPQPNEHGFCPVGYNNCGESFCFPSHLDCPITNLMILPGKIAAPANQKWEAAGTFADNNHTLYVRRNYRHELPVVDLVVRLAEHNRMGENKRGICYDGPDQVLDTPLVANVSKLWAYDSTLPDACSVTDSRYKLIDTMPLQDHFLQNLQLAEPACAGFALYSLSDPRYQPALDADYLNSDVKCDFTSKYTCLRDPYQRTDCAAGDDICDGVVNQNICGAYTHAVRSAFPTGPDATTTGIYFAREIEWNSGCSVAQEAAFDLPRVYGIYMFISQTLSIVLWVEFILPHGEIRYMFDYYRCLVLLLVVSYEVYYINQMAVLFEVVASGYCTDAFTQKILLRRLAPVPWIETLLYWIVAAVILIGVESAIQANLTLRHSRLVLRSYVDRAGDLRWRYELEPISGGALVNIQSEQSVFTVMGSRNVRKSCKLGH